MPQPATYDDDEILPALLPPMDGARFPDDFLLLDALTPDVQVLADPVAARGRSADEPVLRLKVVEEAPAALPVIKIEAPLDVTDWGPGPLGQFCCTVADWSDAIADWIDRWNAALLRARLWGARQHDRIIGWLSRTRR
jgi:hypothetical protein